MPLLEGEQTESLRESSNSEAGSDGDVELTSLDQSQASRLSSGKQDVMCWTGQVCCKGRASRRSRGIGLQDSDAEMEGGGEAESKADGDTEEPEEKKKKEIDIPADGYTWVREDEGGD